jgi:receptor protein-tyrosine kinase
MRSREVLAALRGSWWLLVTGLVLGALTGLGISLVQTPLYTSTTQLFVSTRDSASTSDVLLGSQFAEQRVASYARLVRGKDLANRVIDRLGLSEETDDLIDRITAMPAPSTVLIDVAVTDPSAARAQEIAMTIGEEFVAYVDEIETPDAGGASPVTIRITEQPEVPTEPSSPRTLLNVGIGLVAGLVLGIVGALARVRLDRTVKDPEEAARVAGAPVLGSVIRDESLQKRHTVDRVNGGRAAEDFRQLRTNLQYVSVDAPPKVIMVSSAMPAEGKTTLAVNLALALAEAGKKVVLVEADLRRPRVSRYLGIVGGVGLANVLAGTAPYEEVVQSYAGTDLRVLGSGPTPPDPGELLASVHMTELLGKLRAEHDFVVIDAPPLLPVADASGVATAADGVVLSVRFGATRKEQLREAAATLGRVQARLLGFVLNIVPPRADAAGGYGYQYEARHAKP